MVVTNMYSKDKHVVFLSVIELHTGGPSTLLKLTGTVSTVVGSWVRCCGAHCLLE